MEKRTMKRRKFLTLSSAAALYLLTGCEAKARVSTTQRSLPIPKLLTPKIKNGVAHYNLQIKEATHTFFEGIQTDTYGINATYLGPTLLLRNGERVSINYTNQLQETITMHGHGMHVPPSQDGTAHQPIAPHSTWSAQYRVKQKACTNWYHPHTLHKTAEHVYMGLAGLIIIEDEESQALNLPKRYGEDDIPLVLQDRNFSHGQIDYSPNMMEIMHGYVGETFIANGAIEPTFEAEAKEIRFRILNGSNSSVYTLAFSDKRLFWQIATDNSFLETPVSLRTLTLSPAERAEIVVDLSDAMGQRITLQELRHAKRFLTIEVNKQPKTQTKLPKRLTTLEKLHPKDAIKQRTFRLSGMMRNLKINGRSMDMNYINERVPLNQIEIWHIQNDMMIDHNFHIHATHFMLTHRNGKASLVQENERGYKDTVFIPAYESATFIVKMVDYKDTQVPYMYHCHYLEHEDAGMMGQFVVI